MTDRTNCIKEAGLQRFRPYPEYKNSGIEWLGHIPVHWNIERLRATVAGCQNGVWGGEADEVHDVICVRVADFDRIQFRVRLDKPTMRSIEPRIARSHQIGEGDLLLEKSGGGDKQPVGAVVMYDHAETAVCSNFIAQMPVADGCHGRHLTYLHAALYAARVNVQSIKQSTGIQNLDSEAYLNEPVALPRGKEQRTIAGFLDQETAKIDALVAKKELLIDLLQEKRTALITRAVTCGLVSDVPMKDSGIAQLGNIPAHWKVKRLGYVARIGNGSTPNRNEVRYWLDGTSPWLTSAKINERVIETADQFVTEAALRECHLPSVTAGSVLVAITGEGQTRGRAALLRIDSTISQHLAFMTPQRQDVHSAFLVRLLEARYQWLRDESSGSGSTRGALTCEFLKSLRCAFPPREEQREIAKSLDRETTKIDALIAKVREAIEHLDEFRTALISAAVTGKIDVRQKAPA